MELFQEAIGFYGLSEIPIYGQKFTWSNNRIVVDFTKECLDKVMANQSEMDLFLKSSCTFLLAIRSDYSLLVITMAISSDITSKRKCNFIDEVAWKLRDECTKVIRDAQKEVSCSGHDTPYIKEYYLTAKSLCKNGEA